MVDPLGTAGAYSDGDRHALPPAVPTAWDGAFRTPTLRCISQQPSFMHTGQMTALEQVIAFFDRGGDRVGGYPGVTEIAALGLSDRERADLTSFIQSLEGPGPSMQLRGAP